VRLDTKCPRAPTLERLCSLIVVWERESRAGGAGGLLGGPGVRALPPRAGEEPGARQGAERTLLEHE